MHPYAADMRATLAKQAADERAAADRRAQRVFDSLPEVAAALRTQCGATDVWLFGSLADGSFHSRSDCDLAVRGCSPEAFARALGITAHLVPVDCDLVWLDRAQPALVTHIETTGRRL